MRKVTAMKHSLHTLVAALLLGSLTGCGSLMLPPGYVAANGHPGAVHANAGAGLSGGASMGPDEAAPESNNCITATACNYDSDCPNGGHCSGSMRRCFDPEPVASRLLTCHLNTCLWDTECPAEWSCNSATRHCQLR
jgi:predicted small lipoprotein YifL